MSDLQPTFYNIISSLLPSSLLYFLSRTKGVETFKDALAQ
jgi:hypothetical protein